MMPYDVLASNFPKAWATIETAGEEVVVTRHRRTVARIVPETKKLNALAMFGDLHGVLGETAGRTLASKIAEVRNSQGRRGTLRELRNPWAT